MKQQLKYALWLCVFSFVVVSFFNTRSFLQPINLTVPAAVYLDGVVVEETTVTIQGNRSNYVFHDNQRYTGMFAIDCLEWTTRDTQSTLIEWNEGENLQTIRYWNWPFKEDEDIQYFMTISQDMTQFGLLRADGAFIVTSPEVLAVMEAHFLPSGGVTEVQDIPALEDLEPLDIVPAVTEEVTYEWMDTFESLETPFQMGYISSSENTDEVIYDYSLDWFEDFTYGEASVTSTELALWLFHSDGAYSEGPMQALAQLFRSNPIKVFEELAPLEQAPFYRQEVWNSLVPMAVESGEDTSTFDYFFTTYEPKTALDLYENMGVLYEKSMEKRAQEEAFALQLNQEFSLMQPGQPPLTLGIQAGDFPWGHDFGEVLGVGDSVPTDTFGEVETVEGDGFLLQYCQFPTGEQSFTSVAFTREDFTTPRDIGVGASEEALLAAYPEVVVASHWEEPGFDTMYLYEPGYPAYGKRIVFYMKEDAIGRIEIVHEMV